MKELALLAVILLSAHAQTSYMAQKSCTFDIGTCEGWALQSSRGQIVNTSIYNFTTPYNYNHGGYFLYYQASSDREEVFLSVPTYYRLCEISMAYTLNMTALMIFPQQDVEIYTLTTTTNESLIQWNYVTIPVPNRTLTLPDGFRNNPLWFRGYIAEDFEFAGESVPQSSSFADDEFYIGIDNVTLTYCLPCNFDMLQEEGNLVLMFSPSIATIRLIPLGNIAINIQASSPICTTERFVISVHQMSPQLRSSAMVTLYQSTASTAQLSIRFTNYNSFTGGAQNFTIDVSAYIERSNYFNYGPPPTIINTITIMQPGLISTTLPPPPIYYVPMEPINYQVQATSILSPSTRLKYEYEGSNPSLLSAILSINLMNGLIYGVVFTDDLPFLDQNSYYNVTVTDTPNDKYILITIPVMLGEIAPIFEDAIDGNITITVPENTPIQSTISTIRVNDLNNDTISIYFGNFTSGPSIFSIDSDSLILDSPLDYETRTTYIFNLEATELSSNPIREAQTSTATITVQVTPVNEYAPMITPIERPVSLVAPETSVGSLVLQVEATDGDSENDGTLNYFITSVTQNGTALFQHPFTINITTGAITTTQLLREGLYSYTIRVLVTDMSSNPMTSSADFVINVIGHQRNVSCDFSVNSCNWETEFHVVNTPSSSSLVDYSTGSTSSGGYIYVRGNQITGGTKIFLVLRNIFTSVINDVFFVYQISGTATLELRALSVQTIWSSAINAGTPTGIGNWRILRLYADSFPTDSILTLELIVTGSSINYVAVDDINIQVQSECNYNALYNPANFNFDLPDSVLIPLNDPYLIQVRLTLNACTNAGITYRTTTLPNYIEPYVSYDPATQSIQVQALNNMLASNGTTGVIMISAAIMASDLFDGTRTITYNDSVNFMVVSLQQCVPTDECGFTDNTCGWQIAGAIATVTSASAIQITDRNSGQLVSADYSSIQEKTLLMSKTINGSYCRISFYYYATSGITLSVSTPGDRGELWISSESGLSPEQWNEVSIHVTYSISDPRVDFALSLRVDGTGLVAIDDVSLHPCIDCQTGCRNLMCPMGEFYTLFNGCQPCLAGYYCPGGTASAIPCAAGTFNDAERSVSSSDCRPCPDGSFSTTGSAYCSFNTSVTCALGSYPTMSGGITTCVPCSQGSACPNGGITWECPEGFYTPQSGAVNCTICPVGYRCPTTTDEPIKCDDDKYSFMGEISCRDCPQGFMCGGNISFPQPIITQPTTCSNDDKTTLFIIIIVVIICVALFIMCVMLSVIVRLRRKLARLRKVLAAENNKTAFASRTGNITMNTAYQPFNKDQRFDKDQVLVNEDEEDTVKYRTWENAENAGFDEDEDEEMEMEMTERSMKLLVSTNANNSAEL
ncbi:uncharacterized protein [Dysidea avara]|uniref:uncharacterized protein isoform X2 n=1 Tax=Dysidea avara TaxID=196820 RepID=UPI00333211DE